MVRGKFQAALLKEVDQSRVKVGKKLVSIAKLPNGKVFIEFEDGETDEVDLLVAADGIRSVSHPSPPTLTPLSIRTLQADKTVHSINRLPNTQDQIQRPIRLPHHNLQIRRRQPSRHRHPHPQRLHLLAKPQRSLHLHQPPRQRRL